MLVWAEFVHRLHLSEVNRFALVLDLLLCVPGVSTQVQKKNLGSFCGLDYFAGLCELHCHLSVRSGLVCFVCFDRKTACLIVSVFCYFGLQSFHFLGSGV